MQLHLIFASLIGMQMALAMPAHGDRQTRPLGKPQPELFDREYPQPELISEAMPELFGNPMLINQGGARMGGMGGMEHEEEEEEDEYAWKWLPATPCQIDNATATVYSEECPHDLQCNMGPAVVMKGNETFTAKFCAMPGKHFLFHACSVKKERKVIREQDTCVQLGGRCNVGPIMVQTMGETVEATFCSLTSFGLKEKMANMTKLAKRAVRACRVEDDNGNDVIQRPCPEGYACTGEEKKASFMKRDDLHAHFCEEKEEEWKWTLEETIKMLVHKKGIAPGIILSVMHHMVEEGYPLVAKKVAEYAMMKAAEQGDMGDKGHGKEEGKGNMGGKMNVSPAVQAMMHKLHHAHMWEMEKAHREGDMDMGMGDMGHGRGDMGHGMGDMDHGMGDMGHGRGDMGDMGRGRGGMGGRRDHDDHEMKEMFQMMMQHAEMARKEASGKKEEVMEFMQKMMMMKGMMAQMQPKNDMEDLKKVIMVMMMGQQQQPKEDEGSDILKMVTEMMMMKKGKMEGKDDFDMDLIKKMMKMDEGKGKKDGGMEEMMEHMKEMMMGKGGDMKDMMKKLKEAKDGKGEGDLYMLLHKMEEMFKASGMREEDIPEPIAEMIHYLHHAHLWETEKKMRAEAGIAQKAGDGPAEGLFMLLRKMEQMFEASGMRKEDIPEPIAEMMHHLHHAHLWEVEKEMREEAKKHGEEPAEGAELYMLLRKMEQMFEASGMRKEDIPEPIAEMIHYLHHAHLWEVEKQMREDKKGGKPGKKPSGDLYMLLSKMEQMFEASGMRKEDIPEPIAEMIHMLHHEHLWKSEKKYRMTGNW